MATTQRKRIILFAFSVIVSLLFLMNGASRSEAAVNGMLRQVGNQQVLNLWGSNYEMGYAHGYLMADRIRNLVDHYMIGEVVGGSVSAYNALLARDAAEFQWQQPYLDEIRGMADGMAASGKSLYVSRLGRAIDSRDIRAINLQEEFYFGCSSFGVWGNATANGETIVARNLDFYYDSQGDNANYQMIIAYEPTGKTKFISFGWPGFVGVYSGMNERGVTVMANTGNISNPYGGPFHPVMDVYRSILETTTPANFLTQPIYLIGSFHENPSEIIQMGNSYLWAGYPVYYIEQSPDLDLVRYPADNNYNHIIATNHFLGVIPPPGSGESKARYDTIRNGLINFYNTGDRKVDSTEAFGILRNVANIVAPTLTSIVLRPNRMEFDLSFAKVVNGVFTAATSIPPQSYSWASLFPAHGLLAVNDAYSTAANTTLSQGAPGVLGNDQGTGLTAQLVGAPSHGSLTLNPNGSFVYAPVANYTGSDSFTYLAREGTGSSNVATVTITVTAVPSLALSSVTLVPTSVAGGTASQGTVRLSGPAPSGGVQVTLSDNSSSASVPASVTVAGGSSSASFTVATYPVASSRSVTISARYAGVTKTATLAVTPPALGSLTLSPTSVTGGKPSQGTVRLSGPAPSGGVLVSLSDNSSSASVPASVTVASGSTSATFTVTTYRVNSSRSVTVSASYGGVAKTAVLTVLRR